LLEGLEVVELSYKESILTNNETCRFDSEYFQKSFLENIQKLRNLSPQILENLADVKGGKRLPLGDSFVESGVSYIRAEDVKNSFVQYKNSPYISEKTHAELVAYQTSKNDVLLTIVGNSIGDVGIVKFELDKCNLTENCVKVIPKSNQIPIISDYLFLFFLSHYGQVQIEREKVGTAQPKLAIERIRRFLIPVVNTTFQKSLSDILIASNNLFLQKDDTYAQAETILLNALGMADFSPSTENVNVKSFKESFLATGRLDGEYYQPKYEQVRKACFENASYIKFIREIQLHNSRGLQPEYVENGKLDVINSRHILEQELDYKNFEKTTLDNWDNQPKARVFRNDILIYTTGANIGRTQVYLSDKQALASNHVNILRIQNENPIYVAFVLNSKLGRLQTEQLSAGSAQQELYPKDIENFYIPFVPPNIQSQIANLVQDSFTLKAKSERLLEVAKRAVEIAIEQDEAAGMAYIEANIEG